MISAEAGIRETASDTSLGFVLVDAAGVIAASATHDAPDGRHAFSVVVPEGRYTLRAAARDSVGRQGSVERVFRAHLAGDRDLRVGDLMLARPAPPGVPLQPLVDHASGSAVVAYLELQADRAVPAPEAVHVHITSAAAPAVLVSVDAVVSVRDDGWVIARALVPVETLPPGTYVARAEIVRAGSIAARAARPFTLTRQ